MKYTPALLALATALVLSGCGGGHTTRDTTAGGNSNSGSGENSGSGGSGGGYYLNDGPLGNPPPNLDKVPDAVPHNEPLKTGTMKSYTVMGKTYTPMARLQPYKERGVASWYGRRFHGQKTASGEIYDMYAMTAAHPILPIPSYARVTNLDNGKSVIVKINDRGPFLSNRLIDLSYAAAYKLDIVRRGHGEVEVESIIPGQDLSPPPVTMMASTASSVSPTTPIVAPPVEHGAPVIDLSAGTPPADISSAAPQEASAPEATAPEVVEMETSAKGIFLQLGAFSSQDNAENYVAQLKSRANWLASALQIYSKDDGLFRVHAGPFADPTEARSVADRLNQALGINAVIINR